MNISASSNIRACIITIIIFAVLPLHGQVSGGAIQGVISDSVGAVLPGASITVENVATGETRSTVTNTEGLYRVPNLLPGSYKVTAAAQGFANTTVENITVTVGGIQEVNLNLRVGTVLEKVEVTSAVAPVELSTSATSATVYGQTVRELPLNGRDWTMLATLQPGVAAIPTQPAASIGSQRGNRGLGTELTVAGNRPQQNNYRLDGISINDYSNGAPGSVLGLDLGVDGIQEFSVITSNAPAEYGKTAGGIINAITRSGGNSFHGSAYDFLRNSALDARNFFDQATIAPFKRNQFGATAGGPIRKNHAYYFGDYEGIRQALGVSFVTNVPSLAARNGMLVGDNVTIDPKVLPFLNLYPAPNSADTGDFGTYRFAGQQVTREDFFTIRNDYVLSTKDRLFGTFMFDDGVTTSPDSFNIKTTASLSRRTMVAAEETHSFGTDFLNTLRAGFSRVVSRAPTTLNSLKPVADDKSLGFIPGLTAGFITVPGLTQFTGGSGSIGEFDFFFNTFQYYDDAFYARGKHAFHFGAAAERDQINQHGGSPVPNGQFTFGSLANFLTNKPSSFTAPLGGVLFPRDLRQTIVGAYFQDDWRYRSNLTFNLGLRYEMATVPTETAGRLATLQNISDAQPKLGSPYFSNPTLRDFAPRIGLSWDPSGSGKTAVRAAFGIYDVLPMTYEVDLLSILTAPYFQSGSVTTLATGTFPTGAFQLLSAAPRLRYSYVQSDPKRNYLMQWNLNVQRQLLQNLFVQLGYTGSHGVHQPFRADDINYVLPTLTSAGYAWPLPKGSGTTTNPNPGVGQVSALWWNNSSRYDAMNLQVIKQMQHGFSVQGAYTWSKSIDTGSASISGDTFSNGLVSPPFFDPRLRRGPSDFDIRHVASINYLWLLPSPANLGFLTKLAGGWQWGAILQANTGVPFSAMVGGDPMGSKINISDPFAFADRQLGSGCSTGINPGNPNHYIKTECFAFPNPAVRMGNAGRNSLRGPGLLEADMSLMKSTPITKISESFVAQFRVEVFNIVNRANFNVPTKANIQLFNASGTPLATAGALTSTVTPSRQVQLALKLIW